MSGRRLIRVSSRALGERVGVRVYVYDDVEHLRRDMESFNGSDPSGTIACCQAWTWGSDIRVLIRLAVGHLGTRVVAHEMHHAAAALYGAHVGARLTTGVLTHWNEPFAHLFSDLLASLADRLWAFGYYD